MTGSSLVQTSPTGPEASASRNRLPASAALGYVGVVARRIGAVITPPRISVKSTEEPPPAVSVVIVSALEPAIVIAAEPASVKSTSVKSIAVEPAVPAMRPSIGEIWLAERGSAQQSSCKDSGRHTYPVPWFVST
jgi:hypothetical protein